jgi:site-specific DNA-adenine methylase
MTLKKSKIASKQLDLSGNIIIEQKIWKLPNSLYSLNGTKGTPEKALPHIEYIPVIDDNITDFYEPFAGAANISRFMAKEGRLHDDITLHLNDANKLNYYKLKAVKESPEELISAIQKHLPINHKVRNITGLSLKNPSHPDYELANNIQVMLKEMILGLDLTEYNIEVIAKLFIVQKYSRNLYYMYNGTTNQDNCNTSKGDGTIIFAHLYNGSTIREWSEFLNYYNTELTCNDYKNVEFGNPETSVIYCDSPYPNTAQSSTEINTDEYCKWLNNLENNGYTYTISCNHKCIAKVYHKLSILNPDTKAQTKLFYLHSNQRKDGKLEDGVLINYID